MTIIPDVWVTELNILINHTGDVYTDNRLKDILIVPADHVIQENEFNTAYTADILTTGITPDFTDDNYFSRLTVLKGACLTDQSTFRSKALVTGFERLVNQLLLSHADTQKHFVKL